MAFLGSGFSLWEVRPMWSSVPAGGWDTTNFVVGALHEAPETWRISSTWIRASGGTPFLSRNGEKKTRGNPWTPLRWVMICRVYGLYFGLACGPLSIRRPRRAHRLGARGRGSNPLGIEQAASVRKNLYSTDSKSSIGRFQWSFWSFLLVSCSSFFWWPGQPAE